MGLLWPPFPFLALVLVSVSLGFHSGLTPCPLLLGHPLQLHELLLLICPLFLDMHLLLHPPPLTLEYLEVLLLLHLELPALLFLHLFSSGVAMSTRTAL